MGVSVLPAVAATSYPTVAYPGWRFKSGGYSSLGYYDFGTADQYARNMFVGDSTVGQPTIVVANRAWAGDSAGNTYTAVNYNTIFTSSPNSTYQMWKVDAPSSVCVYSPWLTFTGVPNNYGVTLAYANGKWFYGTTTGLYVSSTFESIGSFRISGIQKSRGVAYGNSTYVHVSSDNSSTHTLHTSTDATTWTSQTVGNSSLARDIVFGNGKFVLARNNSNGISYSTDGISWTQSTISARGSVAHNGVTGSGSLFVASSSSQGAGSTPFSYSVDGVTWTTCNNIGIAGNSVNWPNVTYGNGYFVAISTAWDTSSGSSVWNWYVSVSTNGSTWSTYTLSGDLEPTNTGGNNPNGVAFGDGSFVISGGNYSFICTGNPTGVSSWKSITRYAASPNFGSALSDAVHNGLRPIIYDGTRFIAINQSNISYSTNGLYGSPMQIQLFQHSSGQTLN